MYLNIFGIWAPCMGPWDPWPKKNGYGPLAWALGTLGPLKENGIFKKPV